MCVGAPPASLTLKSQIQPSRFAHHMWLAVLALAAILRNTGPSTTELIMLFLIPNTDPLQNGVAFI